MSESTQQYVERVGSVFAIAVYRDQQRKFWKKANEVEEVHQQLKQKLDDYFDTLPSDSDELIFDAAMNARRDYWMEEARKCEEQILEAVNLGLPGTNPGKQEHLDGNGIQGSLDSIREEFGL